MTLYLPPFYGETTPAPDQRGGVGVDDRLMREPRLMVPRRKPVGPVKIDWSHPLAKNVVRYLYPTHAGVIDLVTNQKMSVVGSGPITRISTIGGIGWVAFNETATAYFTIPLSGIGQTDPITFIVEGYNQNNAERGTFLKGVGSGATDDSFKIDLAGASSNDPIMGTFFNSATGITTQINSYLANRRMIFGSRHIPGIYFDTFAYNRTGTGSIEYSSASADARTRNRCDVELQYMGDYTSEADGESAFGILWSMFLTNTMIESFYSDPYQFLIPA